jgi:radical SAM/Cys-rich protein
MMDWDTMEAVANIARQTKPELVDITGGSPELNPLLKKFVMMLRASDQDVQVRTNLTVISETSMGSMVEFYKDNGVKLVASLPCYTKMNVDAQRGSGVYKRSIEALKRLNDVGYGSELRLDLVYNPGGAFLPGEQASLESDYRDNLQRDHGVVFSNLRTITNMPIGRFQRLLERDNEYEHYDRLLRESFNPQTLDGLMCRHQIEVAWDGLLYDCDFNLALHTPIGNVLSPRAKDFAAEQYFQRRIVTGNYCFGCTAGHGSSCRGALVTKDSAVPVTLECKA